MTAPTIRWPISFADAILAEMGLADLPLDVAAIVRDAESRAYARGRQAMLREVTLHPEVLDHLGSSWRDAAMAMRAEQIQHREECAQARADARREAVNVAAGRHPGYRYRGGPVDWHTGLPVGSACAWLRRQRGQLATVTQMPERAPARQERQAAA